jgi:tRNA dimethylallyltransferase
MTIGTGKDPEAYQVDGRQIQVHLIDICDPGERYNVFRFQRDFHEAFGSIRRRGKIPILCGGSGLYIESVLRGYRMPEVPVNPALRERLEGKGLPELEAVLQSYRSLHNGTDVDSVPRALRAIEIEDFRRSQDPAQREYAPIRSLIVGLDVDREVRRRHISTRLTRRLEEGLIEEVRGLLAGGLSAEDLMYYGLEYKYVTLYVMGELSYEVLFSQLETAIHQFAKRQMTWFRGMERRGLSVEWMGPDVSQFRKRYPSFFPV